MNSHSKKLQRPRFVVRKRDPTVKQVQPRVRTSFSKQQQSWIAWYYIDSDYYYETLTKHCKLKA